MFTPEERREREARVRAVIYADYLAHERMAAERGMTLDAFIADQIRQLVALDPAHRPAWGYMNRVAAFPNRNPPRDGLRAYLEMVGLVLVVFGPPVGLTLAVLLGLF